MSKDQKISLLRQAFADVTNTDVSSPIVDQLLRTLDDKKVFHYQLEDSVQLLSHAGRVLIVLMGDPTMTPRSVAAFLGRTEVSVSRCIKDLVDAGLITRTKPKDQNRFKINVEMINKNSDIHHLRKALKVLGDQPPVSKGSSATRPKADERSSAEDPF